MYNEPASVVRAPRQARTRASWERILETGLELVCEGGVDSLTITEVCRRAAISPPSLYARVDGKAGLFVAVYEYGMQQVQSTEQRVFLRLPSAGRPLSAQTAEATDAIAEVFTEHAAFLRPVIRYAGGDAALLVRGASESKRLLDRTAAAMELDLAIGQDVARMLYAECVLRTIYGLDFVTGAPEPEAEFRARLARAAIAIAIGAGRCRT